MCHIIRGLALLFLACCCAQVAFAEEADDLREKAAALKKEAAALAKKGFLDQAEQHKQKAIELLKAAAAARKLTSADSKKAEVRTDLDAAIAAQQARRDELAAKLESLAASAASEEVMGDMKQQIAKTEKLLHHLQLKQKVLLATSIKKADKATGKVDDVGRRIKHLHVAADNLRAAGAEDLADQLLEKAAAMEKEAHSAKAQVTAESEGKKAHGAPDKAGNVEQQLDELRGQLKQLRAEMAELREQLKR